MVGSYLATSSKGTFYVNASAQRTNFYCRKRNCPPSRARPELAHCAPSTCFEQAVDQLEQDQGIVSSNERYICIKVLVHRRGMWRSPSRTRGFPKIGYGSAHTRSHQQSDTKEAGGRLYGMVLSPWTCLNREWIIHSFYICVEGRFNDSPVPSMPWLP